MQCVGSIKTFHIEHLRLSCELIFTVVIYSKLYDLCDLFGGIKQKIKKQIEEQSKSSTNHSIKALSSSRKISQ